MDVDNIYKIVQHIFRSLELPIKNDVSNAVIPFSKINPNQENLYIYSGCEEIQFKKRHPEYQLIFLNEFMLVPN